MATIFEDPKVIEAAGNAIFDARRWSANEARVALVAALGALDRAEVIETAAKAMADGRDFWDDCDQPTKDIYRDDARAALVAIGLIPADSTDGE